MRAHYNRQRQRVLNRALRDLERTCDRLRATVHAECPSPTITGAAPRKAA
jgi:hypothetical protein